jgi:hypothetical protein
MLEVPKMTNVVRRLPMWSLVPLLIALAPAVRAESVTVPKGTDVPLVFDQALSSKTARIGDRVALHVGANVMAEGRTVIREGTKVTGVISKVEKRKHFGVSAKMQITLNPVHSVTGTLLPLEPKSKGKYTGSRSDQAAYASGGGALLLGPIGLIGGYFVVGKQINIHPGDHLFSEVSRDTALLLR